MDPKTLEYMKARVDAALKINERIAGLRKSITFASGELSRIVFKDRRDNYFSVDQEDSLRSLLAQAYVDLAIAEIERLEKELAEL